MNAAAQVVIRDDVLALSGVLDFDTVVTLEAQGAQWLSGAAPAECRIDLKDIRYTNSAGVSLLLAWLRDARAAGKALRIVNMPDDMFSLIRVCGLAEILPKA